MSIRLLVADDHVLFRRAISQVLERAPGARDIELVGEAGTGREAIARALELRPDVALLDLNMPDGDGLEAARAIRTECPDTRVVILSALGSQDLLQKALAAGAVGFLTKDTDVEHLVAAIHAAHEGTATISPETARQLFHTMAHADPTTGAARPKPLSHREIEILTAVAAGSGDKEIAGEMCLSKSTIKAHLRAIYRKLGARNRVQAVALAIETGLMARPSGGPSRGP